MLKLCSSIKISHALATDGYCTCSTNSISCITLRWSPVLSVGLGFSTVLAKCHSMRDQAYPSISVYKHGILNQIANALQFAKVFLPSNFMQSLFAKVFTTKVFYYKVLSLVKDWCTVESVNQDTQNNIVHILSYNPKWCFIINKLIWK